MTMSVRCGIGYDVHRLVEGRKLILGGVEIAHSRGLEGHSDADVLSHAIADALLGAIGAGDIGQHFPNTDESIRGINSIEILKQVSKLLAEKKARVLNIDATIIAEEPKIAPHVSAMRKNIASAIDGSESDVSIKATTNEKLGAIGRSEGIAAMAVASVEVVGRDRRAREKCLMALRFFNTYSRKIEEFEPRDPAARAISIYTCGPTVYSRAHIGNFRAYIFEDLLQRHLELRGYKVHRVMNITDVDDKTIRGAREARVPLTKFTEQFKNAFFQDAETLRIKRANEFPAATDQRYIDRMIEMIGELIARGLAYQADDKSVYFRINKFPDYGKLAHFDLTQLQSTGRVKHDEYDKEHIGDFALWKAWDDEDGDVKWDSPWGPGRPGWHIECSAMATALLGDQIDIHCGGVDNIFPHHEAEIAQSEGVTGKKFVRYWLHCAHLLVDGQKMAKSLGNFYTVPDVLAKNYTGREIRYALLRVHYRVPLNFTWEGMKEARESLGRIDEWLTRLKEKSQEANVQRPTSEQSNIQRRSLKKRWMMI